MYSNNWNASLKKPSFYFICECVNVLNLLHIYFYHVLLLHFPPLFGCQPCWSYGLLLYQQRKILNVIISMSVYITSLKIKTLIIIVSLNYHILTHNKYDVSLQVRRGLWEQLNVCNLRHYYLVLHLKPLSWTHNPYLILKKMYSSFVGL